jgi:hypothetical protein
VISAGGGTANGITKLRNELDVNHDQCFRNTIQTSATSSAWAPVGELFHVPIVPRGLGQNDATTLGNSDLRHPALGTAAECAAFRSESVYPDLARLVEAWPSLSASDRAAILTILESKSAST